MKKNIFIAFLFICLFCGVPKILAGLDELEERANVIIYSLWNGNKVEKEDVEFFLDYIENHPKEIRSRYYLDEMGTVDHYKNEIITMASGILRELESDKVDNIKNFYSIFDEASDKFDDQTKKVAMVTIFEKF